MKTLHRNACVRFFLTRHCAIGRLQLAPPALYSGLAHLQEPLMNNPSHPFSLMMEPDRVLRAMAQSSQLRALHRREWHPLDQPSAVINPPDATASRQTHALRLDDTSDPVHWH